MCSKAFNQISLGVYLCILFTQGQIFRYISRKQRQAKVKRRLYSKDTKTSKSPPAPIPHPTFFKCNKSVVKRLCNVCPVWCLIIYQTSSQMARLLTFSLIVKYKICGCICKLNLCFNPATYSISMSDKRPE